MKEANFCHFAKANPTVKFTRALGLFITCFGVWTSHAALTWHWVSVPADSNIQTSIESAMNSAVAMFNTYSDYAGDIPVVYNSGVPTAQTDGYMGWIEFGGSISYRVAMHEMSHWLGTGTYGNWSSFSVNGSWIGGYGNSAIQSYDGAAATIGCDTMHYWPYGWNYDNEAVYPERHIGLIGAMRRDMGLADMTIGYAPGTYCLRNRATAKMLDTDGTVTNGAPVEAYSASGSVNQQWVLSLIPGTTYFTLQSVAGGKYLDSLGNTTNGSAMGLQAGNASTAQQWRIVATDAGFYQIINVASGQCLDTGGQTAEGAGVQGWSASGSWNQQWKFFNVAPAAAPSGLLSQFRPVTAGGSLPGHLPENAVDGNIGVTRWTANGGSYPQWWRVDLGAVYRLTNVITYWYPGWTFHYRIEVSTNDIDYATAVDATGNTVVGYTTNSLSTDGRYLRITTTGISPGGGWASFYDCQVFGTLPTPPTPTGGLLHRYDFTSNANDSVGTANGILKGTATIAGGALNTTAVAGSLSGGAPQNGVQLPPGAVAGITGPFSIESWFVANFGGGYTTLFSFSGNNTASYVLATPARGNSPYASTISVIGGGGSSGEQQASEQYQDNGTRHQLVVTYDGTTLAYYIDGALGSFSGLPPTVFDPGLVLATLNYIGINGGSPWPDNSINGSTLDFRIYGRALTAGQITNLYALGPEASNAAISAVYSVSAAPTSLAVFPAEGALHLSWPADHTGWRLQVQTNSVNAGLGANWVDVAGANLTNDVTLPVDATKGSVFYRLISP